MAAAKDNPTLPEINDADLYELYLLSLTDEEWAVYVMQTPALRNAGRRGVRANEDGEAVFDNPMDNELFQRLKKQVAEQKAV